MSAPPPQPARPGLAIIVLARSFERVHYALAMASAAAATGRRAILFFAEGGVPALCGSPDAPGWHALVGDDGTAAPALDQARIAAGVAGFAELLEACGALGVRMIACEMGLRAAGRADTALRPDLAVERAGLVTLYTALAPEDRLVVV